LAPVSTHEGKGGGADEGTARLPSLDLVRGVAILGILVANIPTFLGLVDYFGARPTDGSPGDDLVNALTLFFIDGKFITLFSILFGAGLAIQFDRARKAGRPFHAYYVRRMALLFTIGLAHFLLIWYGDILTSYAVVGLAALVLSRLGRRGIFVGMIVCFALAYAWLLAITACFAVFGDAPMKALMGTFDTPAEREEAENLERPVSLWPPDDTMTYERQLGLYLTPQNHNLIYRSGTLGDMVEHRGLVLIQTLAGDILVVGWYLLGCFLLGIILLRLGLFQAPHEHLVLIRRMILFGFGIGVPCHLAAVVALAGSPNGALSWLWNGWGALAQALGYLGLLLLWSRSGRAEWLQARFRAVGRLALTNYLMQSVLCALLFYGFGLGLIGRVSRLQALGIVAAIWLLQLGLSPVWLRYFHMGPVEWLWRSLAEGRARPFRRRTREAT
jgi:uncharacterized protein